MINLANQVNTVKEDCMCNEKTVQKATKARTVAQVTKAIGCPELELVKGSGYLYFVYNDKENNIWETESVYIAYLNQLSVEQWSEIGRAFVARMEQNK